jgi:predicted SprT family Zn-dependent metalloprotease
MEQLTRPSAFAPPCPSCQEPRGRARSVTVYAKQRIVQYVCEQCEHQWEMTTEAPTGLLFAEPSV